MNETENKESLIQGLFGMGIIFIILIALIYTFGKNDSSVYNENLSKTDNNQTNLEEQLNSDLENNIYNKYVKQIYDAQSSGVQADVDSITKSYQDELLAQTAIPEQFLNLRFVSNTANIKTYQAEFEQIFQQFKNASGTSESKIFEAQITASGDFLQLSDYDRETLLRLATEYEIFAGKVQDLTTPKSLEGRALSIARGAMTISYILRKMVAEQDEKIYAVWISKYSENMFVIITNRYAIVQK